MNRPPDRARAAGTRAAGSRELRIIAGQWRGRRWRFPEGPDIRPTPDRVRETLFNWLAPHIHGARVLDLFAGSGALGLEALSRGAAHAVFVDNDREAVAALHVPFDIVFLDPPFGAGLSAAAARRLQSGGWLAPEAFVYLETPAAAPPSGLPATWQPWRDGKAGEVGYHLLRRNARLISEQESAT